MDKRIWWSLVAAVCLAAAPAVVPAAAQTCGPLDNGHVADVSYGSSSIFWAPVAEYKEMVLTISGPCEDILHVFGPKDTISFDLREIKRVTDGEYTWQLRRVAKVDPDITKLLDEVRGTGSEQDTWWNLFQAGKIPDGPYVDSESFTVVEGRIVDPGQVEGKKAGVGPKAGAAASSGLGPAALAGGIASDASGGNALATKGTVLTNADGIIRNSLCVGFDCPNSPSFSDTTILLMENNTRIKFDDTSTIAGFPNRDWELQANSSSSGGGDYFAVNDCAGSSQGGCAEDPIFKIEANARANALYVESDGDIGIGTANPVVRLHATDGDTPALRLEQDGSAGFAPQTWDVAGNETTFFIRDVTNGSTLPFRIQPGAASNALFIASDNDVGLGTSSPSAALHIRRTNSTAKILIEETSGGLDEMLQLSDTGAGGRPRLTFTNDVGAWFYEVNGTNFDINRSGTGAPEEMSLASNGDLTIGGTLTELSSRTAKEGFVELDPTDVLRRVVGLPVLAWTYTADEQRARHIGPMAEDFYRAFELGDDDKHIAPGDKAGVALLAIQGLQQELAKRDTRIEELTQQKAELEERMSKLERLVEALANE